MVPPLPSHDAINIHDKILMSCLEDRCFIKKAIIRRGVRLLFNIFPLLNQMIQFSIGSILKLNVKDI